MSRGRELRELAVLFLILGTFGFGGPPAHLAMFEQEVVKKRRWLTSEELLELIGAANLVPGPNSTEVAFAIGMQRAGIAGMLVAGVCFILPAALITGLIASLYVRYGSLPTLEPFLAGTKAAVIGIILGTAGLLAPTATKSLPLVFLGIAALIASTLSAPEALVLIGAGAIAALGSRTIKASVLLLSAKALASSASAVAATVSLGALFLYFLQIGATIYGGGFVLASYLQTGLVDELHWLTQAQLLDAVTVGQITPGPVFTTATFVGYQIGGPAGATLATIAIFLPCLLLVPVMHRLLRWARSHAAASKFLDGVNVAAVALIIAVALKLGPSSLTTPAATLMAMAAAVATFRRVNAGVVALVAGTIMWLVSLF